MQCGQTIFFKNKPKIIAASTVAGPKECAGIVGKYVDYPLSDDMFAESTFERAERKMLLYALRSSMEKAGLKEGADVILSGDLLNQIISASFAARETGLVKRGDVIVITGGTPNGTSGNSDLINIATV